MSKKAVSSTNSYGIPSIFYSIYTTEEQSEEEKLMKQPFILYFKADLKFNL